MSKSSPGERAALDRAVRRVTQAAVIGVSVWLLSMVALAVLRPAPYASVWQVVLGQIVAGRVFAVSLGLNHGYDYLFILYQASLQDVFMMLLLYPVLIAGYRKAMKMNVVGPIISNIRDKAEHNQKRIKPFGAAGLVVFVFIPLWSTGVIPGGIVGHLIGLRIPVTIAAVTAGNLLAVAAWVFFFDLMRDLSERFAEQAPMLIFVAAIAGMAMLQLMHLRRMWRKRRAVRRRAARDEESTPVHEQSL